MHKSQWQALIIITLAIFSLVGFSIYFAIKADAAPPLIDTSVQRETPLRNAVAETKLSASVEANSNILDNLPNIALYNYQFTAHEYGQVKRELLNSVKNRTNNLSQSRMWIDMVRKELRDCPVQFSLTNVNNQNLIEKLGLWIENNCL